MKTVNHSMLRDFTAIVIIILACPLALVGGSMIGCAGQGFNSSCASTAIFISPVILLVTGFAAGLLTRGWTGLMLVYVGVIIGMTAILVLTFGIGKPVPLDPVSGIIASIWFCAPLTIGYAMARLVSRIYSMRRDGDDSTGDTRA